MPTIYPYDPPSLKDDPIDEDAAAAIGYLVRILGEYEDCLTLFICALAGIDEGPAGLMLGKLAFTRRLNIAETLCQPRTDDALKVFQHVFNAELSEAMRVRNIVAHGVYIGIGEDGCLHFLTENATKVMNGRYVRQQAGVHPTLVRGLAQRLADRIGETERILNVAALRQTRLQQEIVRDPKARKERAGDKPPAPPQSFPE